MLLFTNIKTEDVYLVLFLGSWVSVAMAGCVAGDACVTSAPDSSGLPWAETYPISPYISMLTCLVPEGKRHRGPCWAHWTPLMQTIWLLLLLCIIAIINLSHECKTFLMNEFLKAMNNEMKWPSDTRVVCFPGQKEWVWMAMPLL